MDKEQLKSIQDQIEEIQEYIDTELCRKCEEMKFKLTALKALCIQYGDNDFTRPLDT